MNRYLQYIIVFLMLLVFGGWIVWAQLGTMSTTTAGPDFHAQNSSDKTTVYAKLEQRLQHLGFRKSNSPSESDSSTGIHSEKTTRIWFERDDSWRKKTFFYVDLDEKDVRTSIKWEVFGTHGEGDLAKQNALKFLGSLDDWFASLSEVNTLPKEILAKKRESFTNRITAYH